MVTTSRKTPAWSQLRRLAGLLERGALSADGRARAAPLLMDHRSRDRLDPLLPHDPNTDESVPRLYALGRRALLGGDRDEARSWLTKAQSHTTRRTEEPLRARLAFELGCLLLEDGGSEAAESVAAWAETFSKRPASDVLHLRALIADRRGERGKAIILYRRAIASAGSALSPLSRVLELRNLAETLAHESPGEAATMFRHALETLAAHDLHPSLAPSLHNGLAYASICAADLETAEAELETALDGAKRLRLPLIRAYALFNRSIVHELRDDLAGAMTALREARAVAESSDLRDLVAWCWIRESWLALKGKDRASAVRAASSARRRSGPSQSDALSMLDALFAVIDGDHDRAAKLLDKLTATYLARSDLVTAFAIMLWRSVAYRVANAFKGAKAAARDACELRRRGPVRVSPSWWALELVEAAGDGGGACADALHPTGIGILDIQRVAVEVRGEEILIGGTPLAAEAWQRRSGRRVLRRIFAMLVAAHPRGISRDRLADELWPDSEGDKAVRNLYAATKDLRRVLATAPGLRLVARGGGYALELDDNVRLSAR